MKALKKYFEPILIIYFYTPALIIFLLGFYQYTKIRSEVVMCKTYYKEISTWDCYWMPKQLPVKR